ncbi:outer membrane beta-barrel protein [Vibrio coralliilyticus]|uniref:outer membrane beta-barrel protein n=1 Tax=Vibrio coralliilyticus TaxID=190893 RepID=UPI000C164EE8|nr:outer membrane beta-barrel protein [Vibrio coralliilyticus]
MNKKVKTVIFITLILIIFLLLYSCGIENYQEHFSEKAIGSNEIAKITYVNEIDINDKEGALIDDEEMSIYIEKNGKLTNYVLNGRIKLDETNNNLVVEGEVINKLSDKDLILSQIVTTHNQRGRAMDNEIKNSEAIPSRRGNILAYKANLIDTKYTNEGLRDIYENDTESFIGEGETNIVNKHDEDKVGVVFSGLDEKYFFASTDDVESDLIVSEKRRGAYKQQEDKMSGVAIAGIDKESSNKKTDAYEKKHEQVSEVFSTHSVKSLEENVEYEELLTDEKESHVKASPLYESSMDYQETMASNNNAIIEKQSANGPIASELEPSNRENVFREESASSNFYVKAGMRAIRGGASASSVPDSVTVISEQDERNGWTIGAGYLFKDNQSIEISYVDLGTTSIEFETTTPPSQWDERYYKFYPKSSQGVTAEYRYFVSITNNFGLDASAGFGYWETEYNISRNDGFQLSKYSTEEFSPLLSVGVNYSLTKTLFASLQIENIFMDEDNINSLQLELGFKF